MVANILKNFYPIGSVNAIVITAGLSGFTNIIGKEQEKYSEQIKNLFGFFTINKNNFVFF